MSVKDWLKVDIPPSETFGPLDVKKLNEIVQKACAWVDEVHQCPPPGAFSCYLEIYGGKIGPFPLDGCDVEWNKLLLSEGALGTFTPAKYRANPMVRYRHLIQLAPSKHEALTLIHEIGHLAHTTWLSACRSSDIERFRRDVKNSETYKRLITLRDKKLFECAALEAQRPGDPRITETRELAATAVYDASLDEWFARIYPWLILGSHEAEKNVLRRREFARVAIDGVTKIYPPERELDMLAKEMLRLFSPGLGRKLPWAQHNR